MGTCGFGRISIFLDYCFGVCVHQLAVTGRYEAERIMNKKDKAFWCYCLKSFGCSSVKINRFLTKSFVTVRKPCDVWDGRVLIKFVLKHLPSKHLMDIGTADGKTM